jgi:hypothetical protein
LAQAQKVQEIRVFKDLSGAGGLNRGVGFDRLSVNGGDLQGGKLGAFECFAFDLVVELTHAPVRLDALLRIKPACSFDFEG